MTLTALNWSTHRFSFAYTWVLNCTTKCGNNVNESFEKHHRLVSDEVAHLWTRSLQHQITYLNAASYGRSSDDVLEAVRVRTFRSEEFNPFDAELESGGVEERLRLAAARTIGSDAARTGIRSSTHVLWREFVDHIPLRGTRVLVSPHEWGENIRYLQRRAANEGFQIDVVRVPSHETEVEAWDRCIGPDVALMCLPYVSSIQGKLYPVAEICALDRPEHAFIMVDAAQALGRVPIKFADLNCDFIVGTARKWLRAPRQTALFAVSEKSLCALGQGAPDLESPGASLLLQAGLIKALQNFLQSSEQIYSAIERIDERFRFRMEKEGLGELICPQGVAGTICLAVDLDDKPRMSDALRRHRVVAKWCNPDMDEPLSGHSSGHAYLRISPHVYTSDDELETCLRALKEGWDQCAS